MGRGRGKGKRQTLVADHDDTGSGEDEKLPVRRRGRPQKPFKDGIEEEENVLQTEKKDDDIEETKNSLLVKSMNNQAVAENGKKRKLPSQVKENADPLKVENGLGTKTNAHDLIKSVGYRQIGSRRKISLGGLLKLVLSANEVCGTSKDEALTAYIGLSVFIVFLLKFLFGLQDFGNAFVKILELMLFDNCY